MKAVKQAYYIAETMMPGRTGFDFNGSSQSFNVLAEYLFGKVVTDSSELYLPFGIAFHTITWLLGFLSVI